ncbi:hypothetical protein D3C79_875780 [compost metagenome]
MPNAKAPHTSTVSTASTGWGAVKVSISRMSARPPNISFKAGSGPILSASLPPQILPTATETPYTSRMRLTALAPKPLTCCKMGARKVKAVKAPP